MEPCTPIWTEQNFLSLFKKIYQNNQKLCKYIIPLLVKKNVLSLWDFLKWSSISVVLPSITQLISETSRLLWLRISSREHSSFSDTEWVSRWTWQISTIKPFVTHKNLEKVSRTLQKNTLKYSSQISKNLAAKSLIISRQSAPLFQRWYGWYKLSSTRDLPISLTMEVSTIVSRSFKTMESSRISISQGWRRVCVSTMTNTQKIKLRTLLFGRLGISLMEKMFGKQSFRYEKKQRLSNDVQVGISSVLPVPWSTLALR